MSNQNQNFGLYKPEIRVIQPDPSLSGSSSPTIHSLSSLLLYRGVDVGIYTKTPLENAKCMFVHFSVSTWTSNGCSFVLTISWCCRSRRRRLVTRYIKVKRSSEPWIREAAKIANRPSTKNPASDFTLLVELPLIFCQVSKRVNRKN